MTPNYHSDANANTLGVIPMHHSIQMIRITEPIDVLHPWWRRPDSFLLTPLIVVSATTFNILVLTVLPILLGYGLRRGSWQISSELTMELCRCIQTSVVCAKHC